MGRRTHSTNTVINETHNKDIKQTNNNVENEINHYYEKNEEHNNLYGDKVWGGAVASNGDSNYGTAIYKLQNLNLMGGTLIAAAPPPDDDELMNLGLLTGIAGHALIHKGIEGLRNKK